MKALIVCIILFCTQHAVAQDIQTQLRKKALENATDYAQWDSVKIARAYREIQIPKQKTNYFNAICIRVETQEFDFENRLLEYSGATKAEKGTVMGILKVQKFWSLYKDSCYCNTEGLNVKNGNALLMSVTSNFMAFPDALVKDYGIGINYPDWFNGITVLDYTLNEITRLEKLGGQIERVAELKGIYDYLRKELGCKQKSEL